MSQSGQSPPTQSTPAPLDLVYAPNSRQANRKAEVMSRDLNNVGALSFMRTGDPSLGNFADATILMKFGDVPENLDEL